MQHSAKILADSVSESGHRLTTMQVTFPRIVLAEFNTHRAFSRNSASSRAIPVKKMLEQVIQHPYVPTVWGSNQNGMQAGEELSTVSVDKARAAWLEARDAAVKQAEALLELNVHKQLTNRLLEPFMWHTCLVTATDWSNFFNLRNNKDAHPDIAAVASLMQEEYENGTPTLARQGYWHLPLVDDQDWDAVRSDLAGPGTFSDHFIDDSVLGAMRNISCARCARVSYLTHDGRRDYMADLDLYERLVAHGHLSPLEHVARPMSVEEELVFDRSDTTVSWNGPPWVPVGPYLGPVQGWVQLRKLVLGEADILGYRKATS